MFANSFSPIHKGIFLTACLAALAAFAVPQKVTEIRLTKAGTGSVSGQLKGRSYADHRVSLKAGVRLHVSFEKSTASCFFNVLPPGSTGEAMHIGSLHSSQVADLVAPIAGVYTVRTYLMGDAKSGSKTQAYLMKVKVAGAGLNSLPQSKDAKFPGTPYHAKASVACTLQSNSAMKQCPASAIRYGGGTATVVLEAGKVRRLILFTKGKPSATDSHYKFSSSHKNDMTTINIGDGVERYVIPDALTFGG